MLCNPSLVQNLCNDVATFSYTGTITLNQGLFFFKYLTNLSNKNMNVLHFTQFCFSIFFSPSTSPTTSGLQICTSILDSICFSHMPHTLIKQPQNCKFLSFSLQTQCSNVHNMLQKHIQKFV